MLKLLKDARRQPNAEEGMKMSLHKGTVLGPEVNSSLLSEDVEQVILKLS